MPVYIKKGGVGGTSSTGSIVILDEGDVVNSGTKKLNFIGSDVSAIQDSVFPDTVDVYIPSVTFPPFYNQGTAIVSDWVTTLRNVASPTSGYYDIGSWAGGSSQQCFKDTSLIYSSDFFRMDIAGTPFTVTIYGADGSTVLAQHSINIIGNTDVTSDNIRIQITDFTFYYGKYKIKSQVTINIGAILPHGGRISVKIDHLNNSYTYTKTQNNIFFDSQTYTQTISSIGITQNTLNSNKWLSGIRYYDLGDTFDIAISDLDYLNSNSYPTNFINIQSNAKYGISDSNLQGSDLTGWNVDYNNQNNSYNGVKSINRNNFRFIGTNGNISANVVDWVVGSSVNSSNQSLCIDTWAQESGNLGEYFTDEVFRRTSSGVLWDSTQDLNTYDDTRGLMVQNGTLMTRRTDWNPYYPGLTSNPDYTGFTGWGTYRRRFIDAAALVRGSCQMNISGFTLTNLINQDVKIWIQIPGKWASECYLHGPATFDFGTFNGDNDPIRTADSTTYVIKMSFGNLGLDSTHNYFIMHMEIQDPNILPDSIVVSF